MKSDTHFAAFAALNPGELISGGETKEGRCGLASFDSYSKKQNPLPRNTEFLEYIYFLLNICHGIYAWVQEEVKTDTHSLNSPNLQTIYDQARSGTKSSKGFFNVDNLRPASMPSAKQQQDCFNCGVYACLTWSMFVAVERDNPSLWDQIDSLANLDSLVVKPFWDLHNNCEDRMIHFRYKLCRLMEYCLVEQIKKSQWSYLALGRHPLPPEWKYPSKRPAGLYLPPCAGGPIPKAYAKKESYVSALLPDLATNAVLCVGRTRPDFADLKSKDSQVLADERTRKEISDHLILSFVDKDGVARQALDTYQKAFDSLRTEDNKETRWRYHEHKDCFQKSYEVYLQRMQDYLEKSITMRSEDEGICTSCDQMADKNFVCTFCKECTHPVGECSERIGSWSSCKECFRTMSNRKPVVVYQTGNARKGPEYKLKDPPKLSPKKDGSDIAPDAGENEERFVVKVVDV